MIRLTGELVCKSAQDLALVQALLPEHIRLTRAEPGCEMFEVVQSPDPMVWTVSERFISQEAFDAHQARAKSSHWGMRTAQLERRFQITQG